MDDRGVGQIRGRALDGSEVRRWIRGGSPYDGIDQPRVLRRALKTARPEAVPRLRARLAIAEAYVDVTRRGRVKDLCSDRARALLSMWANLGSDLGPFEVTRHASDVLERVRACLTGDVAQGVTPCECGAPKSRGRRYCDRCRDRRRREGWRREKRRQRAGSGVLQLRGKGPACQAGFQPPIQATR